MRIETCLASAVIAAVFFTRNASGFTTTPCSLHGNYHAGTVSGIGQSDFVSTRRVQQRRNNGGGGSSNRRRVIPSPSRAVRNNRRVGLRMMFDQLTTALTDVAKNLGPKKKMSEQSIRPALKRVRRALLDSDVNVQVADALIEGVRKRSVGKVVLDGVTAEQQFIKAMYDELLDVMGGDPSSSSSSSSVAPSSPASTLAVGSPGEPAVVLLAGLQGAGKTTAAGKLALYLKEREVDYDSAGVVTDEKDAVVASRLPKRRRKVLLVAADVYRPAAVRQLQVLGDSIGVPVFAVEKERGGGEEERPDDDAADAVAADPVDIVAAGLAKAREGGYDTVIVDTAGRQVIDADLMTELRRIKEVSDPAETLLIVDAMTGQEAASLTAAFDEAVGLTGAILTKMDGDSRGGAAVSVRGVSGRPIKFVGVGERVADLEPFYPDRMASRILGMGDVVSLVEKAAAEVSDAEAQAMREKMKRATFDFDDFLKQSELASKMGGMAGVAKLMPGMGGQINNSQLREAEARLKKNKAMICSMTRKERSNPELLITDRTARSRIMRIARGSGRDFQEGLQFVSEFQRMRTMMSRMQKQMGGGGGAAGEPEPALAGAPGAGAGDLPAMAGNRAMRRAAKKKRKGGRGGGGGFG